MAVRLPDLYVSSNNDWGEGGFSGGGEFGSSYEEMLKKLIDAYGSVDRIPKGILEGLNKKFGKAPNSSPITNTIGNTALGTLIGMAPPQTYTALHNAQMTNPYGIPDTAYMPEPTATPYTPVTSGSNPTQYRDSWDQRAQTQNVIDSQPSLVDSIIGGGGVGGPPDFNSIYQEALANYNPPSLPKPPDPFVFKAGDYQGEATKMADSAYSPQFAAIDTAEQNAREDNAIAKAATGELYDQLVNFDKELGAGAIARGQEYADARQQRGEDLSSQIGDMYSNSNQQIADLIRQAGGGSGVAAEILPRNADTQNYYQQKALTDAQDVADYYNKGGQISSEYFDRMGTANRARGIAEQGKLQKDLLDRLANFDIQRSNVEGSKAQQIIDMANTMQQQDLGLQQMNYGAQQDYYRNLLNQVQLGNQIDDSMFGRAQQLWGNQYQIYSDNQNRNYQANQDAIQNELERQKILGQNATQLAQINQQNQQNQQDMPTSDTPMSKWQQNVQIMVGDNQELAGDIMKAIITQANSPGDQPTDAGDFARKVLMQMPGLPPKYRMAVEDAAQSYYTTIGGSMGWPYASGNR